MLKRIAIVCLLISVLGLFQLSFAVMSLDEMFLKTQKILTEVKHAAQLTDKAVEESRSGNSEEAKRLLEETILTVQNNMAILETLANDSDYYYKQTLVGEEKSKFEKINNMIAEADRLMHSSGDKMKLIRQSISEKAVVDILKVFSTACALYKVNNKEYPNSINDLTMTSPPYIATFESNIIGENYSYSYKLIDNIGYELVLIPKEESVQSGNISSQNYYLSQEEKIIIKNLKGEIIKTVSVE